MKDLSVIDYRTRCKHCLGRPQYWTTIPGLPYNDEISQARNIQPRCKRDFLNCRNENKRYKVKSHSHLMRETDVRGVTSFSTCLFKRMKGTFGGCRVLISCHCGLMTWMYPALISDNKHLVNRKFCDNFKKYIERFPRGKRRNLSFLLNANTGRW